MHNILENEQELIEVLKRIAIALEFIANRWPYSTTEEMNKNMSWGALMGQPK